MENKDELIDRKIFKLLDGLIINREDEFGWLIEAYMNDTYYEYFSSIKNNDEIMVQVKISREDNDPAFFITNIVSINKIGENKMNVLFQGRVVDQKKSRIEEMLQKIIEEGYQGESLLKKYKELILCLMFDYFEICT